MARRLTCSVEQYHRDELSPRPTLSCSIATTLVNRSPAHAYAAHPRLGGLPHEATEEMEFGSIVHALVLGKGAAFEELAFKDFRTDKAKEARDNARACGRIPVLGRHLERARTVAEKIVEQLARRGVVLAGESEVAVEWEYETDKGVVLCRSMFDHLLLEDALLVDLKVTGDANPEAFARSVARYGYDLQAVAYPRALETVYPELAGRTDFLFALVEPHPPYACLVGRPAGDIRALGELRFERAARTWADCTASGSWPAYGDGISFVGLPQWGAKQIADEEVLHGL